MENNYYIGIDQHKRYSISVMIDSQGKVVKERCVAHSSQALMCWVKDIPPGTKVALEATGFWGWLADFLESQKLEVHLAHPLKVKPFAEKHIKTDRVDARALAQLLRLDYLPESYLAPPAVRSARELLRAHAALVALRTRIKNRIHAYLDAHGVDLEVSRRFSRIDRERLRGLHINGQTEKLIDFFLAVMEAINQQLAGVEKMIEQLELTDARIELLQTIPGIGRYLAALIVAEIGDISRFRRAKPLVSYSRLNPAVWSSGGKLRYGRLSSEGSVWLRWAFSQAAIHAARMVIEWNRVFQRVQRRKGNKTAYLEIARRICCATFHMLSKNINFTEYLKGKAPCPGRPLQPLRAR